MQTAKALFFVSILLSTTLRADDLDLKSFFPAGGQRGTTVEVKLIGTFPNWPVSFTASTEELKIEAEKETKDSLRITIPPDARPGVHWLRVHDPTTASVRRPFVVETVKEFLEDSDECNATMPVEEAFIINGVLKSKNQVDQYQFQLKAGQHVTFSVNANRSLGSPMDCVMQLVDVQHNVVLRQIDDSPGKDPTIQYSCGRAGEYAIRLFAFPETPNQTIGFAGGADFVYRLAVSPSNVVRHSIPFEISKEQVGDLQVVGERLDDKTPISLVDSVNFKQRVTTFIDGIPGWAVSTIGSVPAQLETDDALANAPARVALPGNFTGCLGDNDAEDVLLLPCKKGQKLRIKATARELGLPLDPVVVVKDFHEKQLAKNDDSNGRDSSLDFTVPEDGDYSIFVSDLHGRSGSDLRYHLSIKTIAPQLELTIATEVFVIKPDEELTIPIDVVRKDGFAEKVSIVVVGLPSDVTVTGGLSTMKQESEKKVELKLSGSKAYSGPIRIMGITDSSSTHIVATAPSLVAGQRTTSLWLTVKPGSEKADEKAKESAK